MINSYVGMRYHVPVDVSGDTGLAAFLLSMTLNLAVFNLAARPGSEVPETIQRARDNETVWLEAVAVGNVVLPASATPASTDTREPKTSWGTAGTGASSQRVFTRATQRSA